MATKKQFCMRGHDTEKVGRYPSGWCRECARLKGIARRGVRVRSPEEKERNRLSARRTYANNRDRVLAGTRAWRLRTRYGTTPEEVADKIEQQGNACAICGRSFDTVRFHIDHNHETISGRGILCPRCNHIVACLEDERAPVAVAYVESWQ